MTRKKDGTMRKNSNIAIDRGCDYMAATFKIEKLKDFTIMTNHHLRNRDLSLKAKGLHSLMLSLPEEWNYTLSGLVKLSRDGKDAVMSALKELEKHKYLFRHQTQINTPNGNRFSHMEYYIFQVLLIL